MTAVPQRSHHEPEENERQLATLLDGMLDEVENHVKRLVDSGRGDELRKRLSRHLQIEAPKPASTSGIGGRLKGLTADQVNTLLGFHNCVQALDDHAQRAKGDSVTGKRDAACRDFLREHIEKLKGGAQ